MLLIDNRKFILKFIQIFVVDSSDDYRITESNSELKTLTQEQKLSNVPLLVFANKQDIETSLSADEVKEKNYFDQIVELMELNEIKDRVWSIFACSAKQDKGK